MFGCEGDNTLLLVLIFTEDKHPAGDMQLPLLLLFPLLEET